MNSLLETTFGKAFKQDDYIRLVREIFNHFDTSKSHSLKKEQEFNKDEEEKIRDFTYLGSIEDTDRKSLDVLVVELKGDSKVERARSLQRNLVGKYLKRNLKDSALVAFYSKDNSDWRLSFVKMEYKIGEGGAKVEIGTPPKRYSFLVGENEPSYTAKKQFEPFLDTSKVPTVDEIEKAFSVEKVTKEFYVEIAKKFTELVGGERKVGSKVITEPGSLKLPSTNDDTIKKEFAVRLIGRLLFCWFLKKKKSENNIPLLMDEIISSYAVEQMNDYYHGMLERLFFQILNTPQDKRIPEVNHGYWAKVPFLNGGLFEPHPRDYYAVDALNHSMHQNTLKVPDKWLKELFELFKLYNFTIDESTTVDVDISVDPEMLGRIFENLLAEINPETGETERKSTGSYYTPRPIVEYMVDECLKQYLATQTGIDSARLAGLLSYAEDADKFNETEIESIIDALDRVKILDPACGSGAFPMGILHKMLLILQKVDPKSKGWIKRKIKDSTLRRIIESKFKDEQWDYFRKLGIIRDSIYGVDIQPIAVEIAKLRFFLSLVVDEKIDDADKNRGIEALPNLEFKFVAANSLIGLPPISKGQNLGLDESLLDIKRLKELRDEYFTASGNDKQSIEEDFKETQRRMFLHSRNWNATKSQTFKLSEWNPFEDDASSWFDPEWMFGAKDGFDIVIGNPPYGLLNKRQNKSLGHKTLDSQIEYLKSEPLYKPAMGGMINVYRLFIIKSISLLRVNGVFCEIFPLSFAGDVSAKSLREHILINYAICGIEAFPERDNEKKRVFEAVKMSVCIMILTKRKPKTDSIFHVRTHHDRYVDLSSKKANISFGAISIIDNTYYTIPILDDADLKLLTKIFRVCERFKNIGHCYTGEVDLTLHKKYLSDSFSDAVLIKGAIIDKYRIKKEMSQGEIKYLKKSQFLKDFHADKASHHKQKRIVMQAITGVNERVRLKMTICNEGVFCANSVNYINIEQAHKTPEHYLLAILNSSLLNWIFKKSSTNSNVNGYEVDNLPIPTKNTGSIDKFIKLVEKILSSPDSPDVPRLEAEIDKMVYALYNLTPEEIEIVEGKK